MKSILLTSSALLLASGLGAAHAQENVCPAEIDSFTREYEEAVAAGGGQALSAQEQAELFGLRTTAENFYRSGNLEMCGRAIDRARLMLGTAIAPTAIRPEQLVGMDVRNAQDEYLGEVEDIAFDPTSGRVAYVLVEHGGFLGIGDHLFAVPWRAVTWAPGAEALLLDINEERLESGPEFVEVEEDAQRRREWLLAVHSYYGVDPYWQDNLGSMAMGGSGQAAGGAGATAVIEEVEVEVAPAAGQAGTATTEPSQAPGATSDPAAGGTGSAPDALVLVDPARSQESGTQASGEAAGQAPAAVARPAAPSGGGGADFSALMERIDQLESRIEEMSQQGGGQEVGQAIRDLEVQVRRMAERGPGEEVRQSVDQLREQVSRLAESRPGEELRQAVQQLQQQVREIADSSPGEELRQMVARLESEIRRLSERGISAGGGAAMGQPSFDQSGLGQTGTSQSGAVQFSTGQSGSGQSGSGQSGGGQSGAGQSGTGQSSFGQSGQSMDLNRASSGSVGSDGSTRYTVTVRRPSAASGSGFDQQGASETGEAGSTGTQGSVGTGSAGSTGTQGSVGTGISGPTGATGTQDPAGIENAGSVGTQGSLGAGTVATQGSAATGDAGSTGTRQGALTSGSAVGSTGTTAGQAAGAQTAGASQSCEMGVTQLEEDLAAAEETGVAVGNARSELENAQAMLRQASEALCRAAISRARDDLEAQGFQAAN